MEGLPWTILLAAIALIQLTHAEVTIEMPGPGELLHFYGGETNVKVKVNFPLSANETDLMYSRNIGPDGVVAFASLAPSQKTAVFSIASAKEDSEFRKRTCEFDFEVPDDSTPVIDSLRVLSDGKRMFSVTFIWHVKGNETFRSLDRVDSITCDHAARFRDSKDGKGKKRAEEAAAAPAANGTEAAQAADLAKLRMPEGYHFVEKYDSDDSKARIYYANETSGLVSLSATKQRPRVDGLWVESLDRGVYGACWEADMKLICGQGPLRAQTDLSELTKWAELPLPMYHDWLGVVNYAEGRMLLIMGDMGGTCTPTKNCDYFLLYEMRPNGKIYRHQGAHILLGGCEEPSKLTVDAVHHENGTCFNMACVGLVDSKRMLKFRQACAVL